MIELSTKPYREDEGLTTWVAGLRALATQEDARYPSRVRMMGGEQKLFRVSAPISLLNYCESN